MLVVYDAVRSVSTRLCMEGHVVSLLCITLCGRYRLCMEGHVFQNRVIPCIYVCLAMRCVLFT